MASGSADPAPKLTGTSLPERQDETRQLDAIRTEFVHRGSHIRPPGPLARVVAGVMRHPFPTRARAVVLGGALALLRKGAKLFVDAITSRPRVVRFVSGMVQKSPFLQRMAGHTLSAAGAPVGEGPLGAQPPDAVQLVAGRLAVLRDATPPAAADISNRLALVLSKQTADAADTELLADLAATYQVALVVPEDAAHQSRLPGASDLLSYSRLRSRALEFGSVLYLVDVPTIGTALAGLVQDVPGIVLLKGMAGKTAPHPDAPQDLPEEVVSQAIWELAGYAGLKAPERHTADALAFYLGRRAQGVVVTHMADAEHLKATWREAKIPIQIAPSGDQGEALSAAVDALTKGAALVHDTARLGALVRDVPAQALDDATLVSAAKRLAGPHGLPLPDRQILVDVSAIAITDLKTGIQRVVRAILSEMFRNPPPGYRIEPVCRTMNNGVFNFGLTYARRFTLDFLEIPDATLPDIPVSLTNCGTFLMLDYMAFVSGKTEQALFETLRDAGTKVHTTVYDNLPLELPKYFLSNAAPAHKSWLQTVGNRADGLVCISKAVADSTRHWLDTFGIDRDIPIRWFHLGADLDASKPTRGLPPEAQALFDSLSARPTFLMVGLIEPRKGHFQTLEAMSRLWSAGVDANLVVVGSVGWVGDQPTIPKVMRRLRSDPELAKRLFWLNKISDEYLEQVYARSCCLVAASEGEGFGLPLIEAAQHKLPILARDIPVFREIAGTHAAFFDGDTPEALAEAMQDWLVHFQAGTHPRSDDMPWMTWEQSAQALMAAIIEDATGR